MRIRRMRFDIWLCLLLAYLVGTGASKLAQLAVDSTYDSYVEEHTVAAGDVGGVAGDDVFRAQSIDDLLSHDTFTVVSPGRCLIHIYEPTTPYEMSFGGVGL